MRFPASFIGATTQYGGADLHLDREHSSSSLLLNLRNLRQGYVFIGVCLFVSKITQKLLDQLAQNSVNSWHVGHGRDDWITVVILGLSFVCSFVLFDLCVCLHYFMFPWAVESSPLQFLALA